MKFLHEFFLLSLLFLQDRMHLWLSAILFFCETMLCNYRVSIRIFLNESFLSGMILSICFSLVILRPSPPHNLICGAGWSMAFKKGSLVCLCLNSRVSCIATKV